jgi:hypothetical protein
MKKRVVFLLMSLFALMPALMGSAFAGEKKSLKAFADGTHDCDNRGVPRKDTKDWNSIIRDAISSQRGTIAK